MMYDFDMTRTQIYLDDTQQYLAKQYAQQNNTTVSQILRESLDMYLNHKAKSKKTNPLDSLVGIIKDPEFDNLQPEEISNKIDEILYGN
jgi:hypothetical protein